MIYNFFQKRRRKVIFFYKKSLTFQLSLKIIAGVWKTSIVQFPLMKHGPLFLWNSRGVMLGCIFCVFVKKIFNKTELHLFSCVCSTQKVQMAVNSGIRNCFKRKAKRWLFSWNVIFSNYGDRHYGIIRKYFPPDFLKFLLENPVMYKNITVMIKKE